MEFDIRLQGSIPALSTKYIKHMGDVRFEERKKTS